MSIAEKLRGWCTDWNGAPMARGEPPRDGLHCDDLLDAVAEIDWLSNDISSLNMASRAALREVARLHQMEAARIAEIERLRVALEECAKACYLDEHDLDYKPTKEALIARQALG